ncbi:neuropeptides capa receptor-like [Patiria miniata]|uniref:G-protein coupled receptors family 1 profile domain-containing protein n=1 Tax=Patiria miniata TaxID=46514 RepID=A0A913Z782_PATMI|nr:neuropeptides capa receptor-like [Patiria miniata]
MGSGITSGECSERDTVNISQWAVSAWLYTPLDTSITTIVIPILWSLGIITNLTFLFVIVRVPKLRSDTNIYLAHLSLADLLFLNLTSTYSVWRYVDSPVAYHFPFVSTAQCISYFTFTNTGYYASIALVTVVSLERYLALCHPMKHLAIRGRRRTYRMIGICWLVGLLFAVFTSLSQAILHVQCLRWPDDDAYQDYPSSRAYCASVAPWVSYYNPPVLNIPWLIAMVANSYMYVRIVHMLNKRSGQNLVSNGPNAIKIRNQVAKMLVVNGVVFFLCQTPYRIYSLSGWICSLVGIRNPLWLPGISAWIANIPQFINTLINPLIYGAVNRQYRIAFVQAFRCKSHHSTGQHSPSQPTFTTRAASSKPSTVEEDTKL